MEIQNITGIILSGGKSSRMGSEKGLVQLKGKALIEYSVTLLETICDEILISANTAGYEYLGYKIIPDIHSDCGPIGGLYSCLKESKNDYCFVVPCDVPYLVPEIFELLLQNVEENNAVVPMIDGKIEPLCGIYSRKAIPIIESLIQNKIFKMHTVLKELNAKTITFDSRFNNCFRNINTRDELFT